MYILVENTKLPFAHDSLLLSVAPALTGAYNIAYLVRATPSSKSPSVTSDMPSTLGDIGRKEYHYGNT